MWPPPPRFVRTRNPPQGPEGDDDLEGEEEDGGAEGGMDVYGYREFGSSITQRKNRPGQRARRAKCVAWLGLAVCMLAGVYVLASGLCTCC